MCFWDNAFEKGVQAFKEGKPQSSNPYDIWGSIVIICHGLVDM